MKRLRVAVLLLTAWIAQSIQAMPQGWTVSSDSPIPARRSRLAFAHAMAKVQEGWTKAQVKAVLGPPDDIWPATDSEGYVYAGDEVWCYGTNGHHTCPTLGRVHFFEEKVSLVNGASDDPPSPDVISERELVKALRGLYRPYPLFQRPSHDTLRYMQCANLLISLGKEKALAVLAEYSRCVQDWPYDVRDEWLFWLTRVVFVSKAPQGIFRVPWIGAITPTPPSDPSSWPTFPMIIVDDIPYCMYETYALFGSREPFRSYLKDNEKNWVVRATLLVPPKDPFASYAKLLRTAPFKNINDSSAEPRTTASTDLMYLVQDATGAPYTGLHFAVFARENDLEAYHQKFLNAHAYWDKERQMYVKGDGTTVERKFTLYPQTFYHFREIPDIDLFVSTSRASSNEVACSFRCSDSHVGQERCAVLVVEDAQSHAQLTHFAVNYGTLSSDKRPITQLLSETFTNEPGSTSWGADFELQKGKRVRFLVLYKDKSYTSPVFAP